MKDKLGFANLTETDGAQIGNMALGGLQRGVTTEEMAAAYAMFVNDGRCIPSPVPLSRWRTPTAMSTSTIPVNPARPSRPSTAYLMRSLLQSVVSSGTGTGAYFSGMSIGGKTGTTDDSRDRYFVGFTPYYSAAVWVWLQVQRSGVCRRQPLLRSVAAGHEPHSRGSGGYGLSWGYRCLQPSPSCSDSGLLATEACAADLRGSRLRTVTVAADTAPTESCTVHKMVSYCTEGKHLATASCPALLGSSGGSAGLPPANH